MLGVLLMYFFWLHGMGWILLGIQFSVSELLRSLLSKRLVGCKDFTKYIVVEKKLEQTSFSLDVLTRWNSLISFLESMHSQVQQKGPVL